ncbi:ABC transporter ATP-binding protein [Candidatus Omnitrophota bacterium]
MKSKTLANLMPLKEHVLKHKRILLFGFLLLVFSNLIQICEPIIINQGFNVLKEDYLQPGLLQKVFVYLHIDSKGGILVFFASLYLLVNITRLPFIYFFQFLIMSTAKRIECDLRSRLFSHLQRLSQSYYHQQNTGDIMARFSDDIRCIDEFASAGIALGNYFILAPISVIYLFIIGKELVIYALVPLVGVSIAAYIFSKYGLRHRRIIQKHFGLLSSEIQENLSGIRIVKSYVNEDNQIINYRKVNREHFRKNMSFHKIYGLGMSLCGFLIGLSQLIFLGFGCSLIISGRITPGKFAAFFYQLSHLTWPVLLLGVSISRFQQARARLERINEILLQKPDIEDSEKINHGISAIAGEIRLNNLNFSFEKDRAILRNINIKFEKGKNIAIIGNIGAGKSTLVNLIARSYSAPQKTIFVDNHPIEEIPLNVLRRNIGYVSQEPFLFSGSIRDNICFGVPGATKETLRRAVNIADIEKDIDEFPYGYETLIGERGVTLSGGQKQRIAIARSVIIRPKILLFDNALSQVDAGTEKKILKNLTREMQGCTIIFIANRIASAKNADLIMVLINGQAVESGTHNQLLQMGEIYAAFFERETIEEMLETI